MYPLCIPRAHGLPQNILHQVTNAITISWTLYAAPAWWGLTNARDWARIDWVMDKFKKSGFIAIDAEDISTRVETA